MNSRLFLCAAFAIALGAICVADAYAQSPEYEAAPARGEFIPAPVPPPTLPYVLPDVPDTLASQARLLSSWFTLKIGFCTILDYWWYHQDQNSIAQVGKESDEWDIRAARLILHGTLGADYKVFYLIAGEYKGFESDPENLWQITDLSFTFPLGGPATKLTVGKTKETFGYEMVGDAANLPQQERIQSPFFISRSVGIKVITVIGDGHMMTASAGVFNDWAVVKESFSESVTDVTARVTGLLWDQRDGKSFLHLGIAGRYAGADNNSMRYKGRPESNVTDYYIDTGPLPGNHAWHLGLEALWNEGPLSVLAEYNRAWVNSPASGFPTFYGYYITGSWVLTGETRAYDRTVGYARRVMPMDHWGAPELVVRFSHEDLVNGAVQGGSFNKTYLGVNWWATRRWKMGFGWGHTWLERFATTGVTDSYQSRLQFVF
jgi:phosphate-selective porin OprO/OprP